VVAVEEDGEDTDNIPGAEEAGTVPPLRSMGIDATTVAVVVAVVVDPVVVVVVQNICLVVVANNVAVVEQRSLAVDDCVVDDCVVDVVVDDCVAVVDCVVVVTRAMAKGLLLMLLQLLLVTARDLPPCLPRHRSDKWADWAA